MWYIRKKQQPPPRILPILLFACIGIFIAVYNRSEGVHRVLGQAAVGWSAIVVALLLDSMRSKVVQYNCANKQLKEIQTQIYERDNYIEDLQTRMSLMQGKESNSDNNEKNNELEVIDSRSERKKSSVLSTPHYNPSLDGKGEKQAAGHLSDLFGATKHFSNK